VPGGDIPERLHVTADRGTTFDAVIHGPEPSESPATPPPVATRDSPDHPTVVAMRGRFEGAVVRQVLNAGDQHVVYVDPARNLEILRWLKNDPDQHYDHLADVTAVDYGGGKPLEVVYQLWSIPHRHALRVKCELPLDGLEIDSVTELWRTADWLEREVYDLFGIRFAGHPNLLRILMPENYAEGYPLRKDFPLRGRFSRAEQTRRALSQSPDDYYVPGEIGERIPQTIDEAETVEESGSTSHGD